ncbi:MAG: GYD domain-containing protein [Anaerolineae bacterium]|jgi:uncharacterized protein with GYD domain
MGPKGKKLTTFVLLSRVSPRSSGEVRSLGERVREFERNLVERYPEVKSLTSYALLGPYDFLHIFEAPDANTAARVALLAQTFGAGTTETLMAIPFEEFSAIVEDV